MNAPPLGTNQLHAWVRKYQQVSEAAMAATFEEYQGDCWRYDVDEKFWLQWVGTHWARRQTPEMLDELRHFLVRYSQAFQRAQLITAAEALKLQSGRVIKAIEVICRSLPMFRARSVLFDSDPWLLGTPGGTVELRTGLLRPAAPDDYVTMLTRVTPAETEDCPRWLQFITEVTSGDPEIEQFHQQWAGVNLSGDPSHQKLALLCGAGRNGKNTFTDQLLWILGDYGFTTNFDTFITAHFARHSTELWSLKGKRMVVASEVPDGATWNVQRIKDLTGNATINARGMGMNEELFARTFTLTFLCNNRPKFKNADQAIKARLQVVMFNRNFEAEGTADPGLAAALKKQAAGVLRWAINGLAAVQAAKGKLVTPVQMMTDAKDYLDKYDLQQQFVDGGVAKADGEETLMRDFYTAWKTFAAARDIDPLNEQSMAVWLTKLTGGTRGRRRVEEGGKRKDLATLSGFKVGSLF